MYGCVCVCVYVSVYVCAIPLLQEQWCAVCLYGVVACPLSSQAIVASCGLLAYGVLNLVKNGRQGHAFWRKSWWMAPIEPSAQLQHSLIGLPDEDEDVIFVKDEHVGGVRQSHGSVAAQSTNSAAFSQSSEADIGDAGESNGPGGHGSAAP